MGILSRYTLLILGTLMTGLFLILSGVTMFLLLVNIMWAATGDAKASWKAMLTEALLFAGTSCFLNLLQTFRKLAQIDPVAYREATRDMGVICYIWSTRAAPAFLHRFLVALDCGALPPSFARRVRRTIVLDRLLLASFLLLLAFGIYLAVTKSP